MNLRDLINTSSAPERPYYEFNREERHLAGILFFILNQPGVLERALPALDCNWKMKRSKWLRADKGRYHALRRRAGEHKIGVAYSVREHIAQTRQGGRKNFCLYRA